MSHCEVSLPPSVPSLPESIGSSDGIVIDAAGYLTHSISSHDLSDLTELPPDVEDSDVELPPNVTDEGVGLDMALDDDSDSGDVCAIPGSDVPGPNLVHLLATQQTVAEFYSPPRVLPATKRLGLSGVLSLDILTGWDFSLPSVRTTANLILNRLLVFIVLLSPPCTVFSDLQRLFNIKRVSIETWRKKYEYGFSPRLLYGVMGFVRNAMGGNSLSPRGSHKSPTIIEARL
jgi:hypothetical protein